MGADLIGFLVKGPKNLDPKLKEAAIGLASNVIGECLLYVGTDRLNDIKFENDSPLKDLDTCDIERISCLDPEELIDSLLDVWAGNARDTACRLDPDDPSQSILFTGEMTWGDEPSGYGYDTVRDAAHLGLFELFGIR